VSGRLAELAALTALAAIVTAVMAAPVLRAPAERIFGAEIVGRHHDPFTLMEQFSRPISLGGFSQPVTDAAGALLSRLSGAVPAYNWLILLSFPLSAAAAYLLARHLALSPPGATVAALAYAFSPFHVAQAAYHPHIAQTQWMPLYLFALWRCLDHATPAAVAILIVGAAGVTLSNFYGGLIAAVITPAAVAAYWLVLSGPRTAGAPRRLGVTIGSLVLVAACGMSYAFYSAREIIAGATAFRFPRADLFLYSANWWSYVVSPVEHPLLGPAVRRFWSGAGVREGLLEQQISLGAGIIVLALMAVWWWLVSPPPEGCADERRDDHQHTSLSRARVPILVAVGVVAFVCSLAPERTIGTVSVMGPSALLYTLAPMFRAYARFGVVVQLMAALLAGIAVDRLLRARTNAARLACAVLVLLAAFEYAVRPSGLWRDVLPTAAHRWVMRQVAARALDCVPLTEESHSIGWLTRHRIDVLGAGPIDDCAAPNLPQQLAAHGYTHLLVRHGTAYAQRLAERQAVAGLRPIARMDDADVFAVTAPAPAIYTAAMSGFFPREHADGWTWRWMGASAAWTVVNTRTAPLEVSLELELSAFHRVRQVQLRLDGQPLQTIAVAPMRRIHRTEPFVVRPGSHQLAFHPDEGATVVSDVLAHGERRPLSCALGTWRWTVRGLDR
jgi:hypothetical protein